MIGIIGAMDEEVEQLVEVMEITREETKACMTFKAGKLAGKDVVIVRSGIGKVNAAACTQNIEHERQGNSQPGYITECLLKDIGQGDE